MEATTRVQVIEKIDDYLRHRITLADLVDWAEQVMMEGDFAAGDYELLRDVVARLGVADVRAFGLTWEECEDLVGRLGYRAEVTLRPSNEGPMRGQTG
jgi:hypothetical protein